MEQRSPEEQFFYAFIQADPDNPRDPIYSLCDACRARQDADPPELLAACVAEGCGLRDRFLCSTEQIWLGFVWVDLVQNTLPPDPPPADLQAVIREHILAARCLIPTLRPDDRGYPEMVFLGPTLRARLHATVVAFVRGRAGWMEVNVYTSTPEEIRRAAGRARAHVKNMRARTLQLRAARWRDEGVTDNQIAERLRAMAKSLAVDNASLRDWLGAREEWPKNREDWYRRNGFPTPQG